MTAGRPGPKALVKAGSSWGRHAGMRRLSRMPRLDVLAHGDAADLDRVGPHARVQRGTFALTGRKIGLHCYRNGGRNGPPREGGAVSQSANGAAAGQHDRAQILSVRGKLDLATADSLPAGPHSPPPRPVAMGCSCVGAGNAMNGHAPASGSTRLGLAGPTHAERHLSRASHRFEARDALNRRS